MDYQINDPSFLDLVRGLDHVQKSVKTHLLDSHDVEELKFLVTQYIGTAESFVVHAFGGYTIESQKWPSRCTNMTIGHFHLEKGVPVEVGRVCRIVAPVTRYKQGHRYVIKLHKPDIFSIKISASYFAPFRDPRDPSGESYIINSLKLS